MATESGEQLGAYVRGVTVTTLAAGAGVTAGVASAVLAAGPKDQTGLYLMVAALLVQLPVLSVLGVDVREFGLKDNLYVAFLTFSLWFVSWAILLTAGAFQ